MSEFIYKTEIATLKQSNAELNHFIANLKTELYDLSCEFERLRKENPDDINHLKEKITEYEHREAEFQERILSISREIKNNSNKHVAVKQLLSTLQVGDAVVVEAAIEQYYKKRGVPKIIIAFLLGIVVSLSALLLSNYLPHNETYNTIIERLTEVIGK